LWQVAVVIFGAFTEEVLGILITHHRKISHQKAVKRGSLALAGTMVARGGRVPAGGRPGDAYVPYSDMGSTSGEDLDLLYNHAYVSLSCCNHCMIFTLAQDAECLLQVIRPHHSSVVKDLEAEATTNEGIRMGSTAASLFYCNDYLAKQHTDNDVGIGICAQLEKMCTDQYGYSFAYPEYGFYISTERNTAW
jgi:hypothetical protein